MENERNYYEIGSAASVASADFTVLMRSVYKWMALALGVTALTAWVVASHPNWMYAIFSNTVLFWGLIIAEFALVFIMSARIAKLSFTTAGLLFAGYSILNGIVLSMVFVAYAQETITQAFLVTAGTFAAMSLFGYFTKRDLSAVGRFLFMLLIGVIIATVVNMFMHNSLMASIINYAGVLIFTGLTAYDTQNIKRMLMQSADAEGVTEMTSKIALLGSFTLYLDFVNLFLYLLRIFGGSRD